MVMYLSANDKFGLHQEEIGLSFSEAPRHKSESSWFDSRCFHCNFSV